MTLKQLEKEIHLIYDQMVLQHSHAKNVSSGVHEQYQISAENLYNYLILRSFDLRKLHDDLSDLGISSIRTAEGYVFTKVQNVLKILNLLQQKKWENQQKIKALSYKKSKKLLRKHANQLFNRSSQKNFTEIMVTMPDEAAENVELIRELANAGMEIARINMGHGNIELWKKMIDNIHEVKQTSNRPLKIYMDLAGPKIRTGAIEIKSKKGKIQNFIKLKQGDHLVLTKRKVNGKNAVYGKNGDLQTNAKVSVLLPEIIDDLEIGHPVFFDDGTIEAVVIDKNKQEAELAITKIYKKKLSANKGINLPYTDLNLPSLTEQDLELLPFAAQHADLIGYSFVRKPGDVEKLYKELNRIGDENLGVIFKIETQEAFENLPLILFEAMKRPKIGVMIARGDLAVEIGFERISEVQNQILWLCEAAHVPVIWATQVLENLAKTGMATRAEISDAAMAVQAECVMLNKGPYIVEAVRKLKNILIKMEKHTSKKKSALRALEVAKNTLEKMQEQRTEEKVLVWE